MLKKRSGPKSKLASSKLSVGRRFNEFRKSIGKTQNQLAEELSVYQSTITNLEVGKTFPSIHYIIYFNQQYKLSPTWLLTGIGDKFLKHEAVEPWAKSAVPCHLEEDDPSYEKYAQLLELLRIPAVESVIMGKLSELLMCAKEEIAASKRELDNKIPKKK